MIRQAAENRQPALMVLGKLSNLYLELDNALLEHSLSELH
jgi:hypothetical protein